RGSFIGLAAILVGLAACQTGGGGFFGSGTGKQEEKVEQVEQIDLTVYCPQISLREGTAFFNTYAKAGRDDTSEERQRIIYQASITDATRACRYEGDRLNLTVAVAGKVVLGPKGKPGTITMPIRIAVVQGDEVIYSQLHRHKAEVAAGGATQYVLSDPNISIPAPTVRNVRILVGFDEGPYNTP